MKSFSVRLGPAMTLPDNGRPAYFTLGEPFLSSVVTGSSGPGDHGRPPKHSELRLRSHQMTSTLPIALLSLPYNRGPLADAMSKASG